jgi:hypothetical protein
MGAVAKKDLVPQMKHFKIKDGRIWAFNGNLCLSSPVAFDIDCNPQAETLFRAIESCEEAVSLYQTPGGKLGVKSGRFRALVPCIEETTLHPEPTGVEFEIDGEALLEAFRRLEDVIGDDAARPWQAGILLKQGFAFATCNVVLVQYWLGQDFGHVVNVPGSAVREMLRIGEAPTSAQLADNTLTFHYGNHRYLITTLLPANWPDLDRIIEKQWNAVEFDQTVFEAVQGLKRFVDKAGRVYFTGDRVHTEFDPSEGTSIEVPGMNMQGLFNYEMFMRLKGLAPYADMTHWPKPCYFQGERWRGAIVGMHI